nr:ATP-binding cassette domain-containing protein [Verrucomicrobium spinosum]
MTLIPPENLEKFTQAPASLELYRITKKFGDFTAADEISLTVPPGTVHALLGENGAGKSTLVKCVMGFHPATSGEIMVGGHVREVQHPSDARKYGIGMVYQHFTLVPSMTVTENLVLSRPDVPAAVNWKKETARLEEFMATEAPFKVPLHKRASELAAGEKQKTEILKQLYLKSRILILDEPTSVLTPAEATEVLALLRQMTVAGKLSIIIITHKFREVFSFADDVTVLRRGRLAGQGKVRELDRDALAAMMMGDASEAKPAPSAPQATTPATSRRTALRVKQLSVLGDNGLIAVKEVSFELGEGEVLGIAGVAGNGQRELMEVLGGQRPAASGSLEAHGQPYQAPAGTFSLTSFTPCRRSRSATPAPPCSAWQKTSPCAPLTSLLKHGGNGFSTSAPSANQPCHSSRTIPSRPAGLTPPFAISPAATSSEPSWPGNSPPVPSRSSSSPSPASGSISRQQTSYTKRSPKPATAGSPSSSSVPTSMNSSKSPTASSS